RRNLHFGLFGFFQRIVGALNGISEVFLVEFAVGALGREFVEDDEKLLGFRSHQVDAFADILLLVDSELNEVGGIVEAPGVSVHQEIQHVLVLVGRRMLELILELLQAVLRKIQEQHNAFVGGLGVADFVGLNGA